MIKANLSLFIIAIHSHFVFFHYASKAGIDNSEEIKKWERINKDSFIDTKDFIVTNKSLELKVKSKGYNELSLNIDCENLIYKKRYGEKETVYKPILVGTSQYDIANNLCFLSGVNGFYKDKKPDSWAKIIIKRFEEKPSSYIKIKKASSDLENIKKEAQNKELTSSYDY